MMATVRPGDPSPIERFRFRDERMAPADTTKHRKDSAQTGREAILGPSRPRR